MVIAARRPLAGAVYWQTKMLKIKNWDSFQHYRDRNPPWIKLHRKLLNDREFFNLDGDCVKTLVLLWMLAAETKHGELPAIEDIAFRLRLDSKVLSQQITKLNHWIIFDASTMLANREHDDSNLLQNSPPETERETETNTERETERETQQRARARSIDVDHDFETFWMSYPKKVGKKDAFKSFQKARKSGLPDIHVLVAAIEQQRKSDQWRRDNGQYIPNPSTWINQGRWDDVLKEGPGRKLLPQERSQIELQEWLHEIDEEEQNEQQRSGGIIATDSGIISGEMAANKTNRAGMVSDAFGYRPEIRTRSGN